MSKTLQVIWLAEAPSVDVHRFRNFGEDVFRELGNGVEISLSEIDSARQTFFIRSVSTRSLGKVRAAVARVASRHGLHDVVAIKQAE